MSLIKAQLDLEFQIHSLLGILLTGWPGLRYFQWHNPAETEHLPTWFWQDGPQEDHRPIHKSITHVPVMEAFLWADLSGTSIPCGLEDGVSPTQTP